MRILSRSLFHSCRLLAGLGVMAGLSSAALRAAPADTSLIDALKTRPTPRVIRGDEYTAYRDPLLSYQDGTFRLFFSYVREEEDHLIYWYVTVSESRDLQHWSEPHILTPKDQNLNYSSPGSLVRVGDEWVLCVQSYPIADFRRGDKLRFADDRARLFTMRSRDLKTWSELELIRVKGPEIAEKAMGKMIDPFLLRDKDEPGKWWCFFKQAGKVRSATSLDLNRWTPTSVELAQGENPCVLIVGGEYVLFYASENGVGVKRSRDLLHWREEVPPITLGQKDWPWAEARLTAGYVVDLRAVSGVGQFLQRQLFLAGGANSCWSATAWVRAGRRPMPTRMPAAASSSRGVTT